MIKSFLKILLITALFGFGSLFAEDSYSSHYSKLSKQELAKKHQQRFDFFANWEPKIRIQPSSSPRHLNFSSTPTPSSIGKQLKNTSVFSMMYYDGQSTIYNWKQSDLPEGKPIYGMSMTKSIISYLLGKAYCEGRINSLTDTIGQYTESFNGSFYENVRIIDALNMASGDAKLYPNSKNYAGGSGSAWKYYVIPVVLDRLTIKEAVLNLGVKKPGKKKFNYKNANTDVLAALLVSISTEGFSEFAHANLAEAAGFEYDSYFFADSDNVPLGFAYFWAARSDWLRAAIKIGEDFHSSECIGDYLRSAVEDTVKTKEKREYAHTRYGKFFWSKGVLKKVPHVAMKGHGGIRAYIEIDTPSPRVVLIHSVRSDYNEASFIRKILK